MHVMPNQTLILSRHPDNPYKDPGNKVAHSLRPHPNLFFDLLSIQYRT